LSVFILRSKDSSLSVRKVVAVAEAIATVVSKIHST
jgi:hypothetical protein